MSPIVLTSVIQKGNVEHKPRRLLLAAESGVPVIASRACGVTGMPGIEIIEAGDAVGLRNAIIAALGAGERVSSHLHS